LAAAIYRLKKLKTDDLAISNTKMWLHIGAFFAFTLSSVLLLYSFHFTQVNSIFVKDKTKESTETYLERKRNFKITIEYICILFIALSELPIIHIMDSLVRQNINEIKMNEQENILLEEDECRVSS
jgi:hypothetical protein